MSDVLKILADVFRAEAVNCGTPTQASFLAVADRLEREAAKPPVVRSTPKYQKPVIEPAPVVHPKTASVEKGKTA